MGYKMMYTTLIVFNNESEFNNSFSFPDNEFENKNYFLNKLKIRRGGGGSIPMPDHCGGPKPWRTAQ